MARNLHLGPNWVPSTVVEVLGPVTFIVETEAGFRWKRHADQLKDCLFQVLALRVCWRKPTNQPLRISPLLIPVSLPNPSQTRLPNLLWRTQKLPSLPHLNRLSLDILEGIVRLLNVIRKLWNTWTKHVC